MNSKEEIAILKLKIESLTSEISELKRLIVKSKIEIASLIGNNGQNRDLLEYVETYLIPKDEV
jgi:hypothetical protein